MLVSALIVVRAGRRGHRNRVPGNNSNQSGGTMTDQNIDQAKGRVKEAAGALTGDQRLKSEGHADQAKGSLKKAVDKVAEAVRGQKHERG
ncbi:MAG TPA: CsbD family protein [Solirubrobacteraceae bacterium]|nr:CsbD family protein [Solirubrobacteraceae bacterium]